MTLALLPFLYLTASPVPDVKLQHQWSTECEEASYVIYEAHVRLLDEEQEYLRKQMNQAEEEAKRNYREAHRPEFDITQRGQDTTECRQFAAPLHAGTRVATKSTENPANSARRLAKSSCMDVLGIPPGSYGIIIAADHLILPRHQG